ncbi:PQQ-binding-like beta-propeller repeat protein [candidate division KSB1 bacterium]|nr:PQQ-binding-like beta-propeller repeat protein [candidate division KSB1 bacterium]
MLTKAKNETALPKPLRLWPGVVIVVLQWVLRYILPQIVPDALQIGVLAVGAGGLGIIIWWVFFSRAAWVDRLGAIVLMVLAMIGTRQIVHKSIAQEGMGVGFFVLAIPVLCLAFVAWAAASRRLAPRCQRVKMVATILLACGGWALVRTGGFTHSFDNDFAWRWSKTPEQKLIAASHNKPLSSPPHVIAPETDADWPGFRGAKRDGIVHGSQINIDWTATPPEELWRRPVGPGWSSFAVHDNLVYTQEQRGEDEVVSCYNLVNGASVWLHKDKARFWEANAGAGPRGTPTYRDGCIYTLGATGIVNVLDATDGSVIWSRNAANDTGAKTPMWGFSASPLVTDDVVIIAAASSLIAYDLTSGDILWTNLAEGDSYCSPYIFTIDSVPQIPFLRKSGVVSVSPADGTQLWEHAWAGYPIVQPALTDDGDLLVSVEEAIGLRRLAVKRASTNWTVEERWTSLDLKPYFNDSVIHNGYVYGFRGSSLACLNVADGTRAWKGGRYGRGQFILLADQDVLLVLAEKGDLALVKAVPDQFTELARIPAIKGKTWNHPVLVGDILLLRNGQEMAAFRVAKAVS